MGLFETLFGPRPKQKAVDIFPTSLSCDSTELNYLITRWTENEGWKPKTFADILEEIGVKGPWNLKNLNKENCSFDCTTGDGTTVEVTLRFGDAFDFCSEIWITRGEESKRYETWSSSDNPNVLVIQNRGRILKRGDKSLESYYCEFFCDRTLKFGDTHTLRVYTYEPLASEERQKVLNNAEKIEEYLMGLEEPVSAQKVYEEVIKLLGFSEEDIRNSELIIVAYRAVIPSKDEEKQEEETRSLVYLKNGEMQEYAILENGETFVVCRNRNWRYISDTVKIYFTAENHHCNVAMENAGTDQVKHLQLAQLMEQVEERIVKMWKYVE